MNIKNAKSKCEPEPMMDSPLSNRTNPVLVEITRGGQVESRHRGAVVVMDSNGRLVGEWGDGGMTVFPRSAIKPLQALPFLETGAAAYFSAAMSEVALACASHNGEPIHTEGVKNLLRRAGLAEDDLECGPHQPMGVVAAKRLIREDIAPGRRHNNCSGKHAAMLATAQYLGEPPQGYSHPNHPVQGRVQKVMTEMCGLDFSRCHFGIDGCGLPNPMVPLWSIAEGMAHLAKPDNLTTDRQNAAKRIVASMMAEPYMVAGHDRFDTVAMEAGVGKFVVKTGAEGVYSAIIPSLGYGVAIKIEDGAKRASEAVMAAMLAHLGLLDEKAKKVLEPYMSGDILNAEGKPVGAIRLVQGAFH